MRVAPDDADEIHRDRGELRNLAGQGDGRLDPRTLALLDGTPLAKKHGFAADGTTLNPADPINCGSFASAASADFGGLFCCAGVSALNAVSALFANVPSVTVCGSPTPT